MFITVFLGTKVPILPNSSFVSSEVSNLAPFNASPRLVTGGSSALKIECSSRPQKKATAHHRKTRPRKTQAWDIRRKPTVYPPVTFPPDWTLVTEEVVPEDSDQLTVTPPGPEKSD